MLNEYYLEQVKLLIRVLPYIDREKCFALKGGTGINFFIRNLPRLSVDIDLTYLGFEDRSISFENINAALHRIEQKLRQDGLKTVCREGKENIRKIICRSEKAQIIIEPNYTLRGFTYPIEQCNICPACREYGYASIQVASLADLYGGKICAALDRQHPRDLFDIKNLMDNEGLTPEIMNGFIAALCGHNRPPHELLKPNRQSYSQTYKNEFMGMSEFQFNESDCNTVFDHLVTDIHTEMSILHKEYIISFFSLSKQLPPTDIPNCNRLPGLQWKRINLRKLQKTNPTKFTQQMKDLENCLQ
ncbi:MAG: nucleotidyl transferase AbiEii/AbiGii toxin family protein [Sphaerochaeta sp.]|nr:nucleotidyl transferase AbiEii/AbiGii toxin family protein [Sphaerochaeta sp.]